MQSARDAGDCNAGSSFFCMPLSGPAPRDGLTPIPSVFQPLFIKTPTLGYTMSTRVYPLDLPDIKAYLNIALDDTSQDAILTECSEACTDELARYITRSIIERDCTSRIVNIPRGLLKADIPLVQPMLMVKTVTAYHDDGTTTPCTYTEHPEYIRIRIPAGTESIEIIYRTGIDLPPTVRSALLMMVKSRYERRDEDPLSPAVLSMVRPYMRANI